MAMVFISKAVLMQYSYSLTLPALQQLVTALLIHFGIVMGHTKVKVNMTTAKKLLPVSVFYNANVAFALASLKGINIPMYIALKRLTPLAILVVGFFRGKGRPSTQVSLSVILTAVGVIIAALGDFSFDFYGYTMALTSVFFQTMYLVLVEKSGAEEGLTSIEIMFYNALISLPFLLFIITATREFPHSISILYEKAYSFTFLVILILSMMMAIVLNFTMFWCTIVNSALTTTIVGVLKGVGSTFYRWILGNRHHTKSRKHSTGEGRIYFKEIVYTQASMCFSSSIDILARHLSSAWHFGSVRQQLLSTQQRCSTVWLSSNS